jgi:hypothetical protein
VQFGNGLRRPAFIMRRIRLHRPRRRPLRDWIRGKVKRAKRIVVCGLAIHAGAVAVMAAVLMLLGLVVVRGCN